MREVIPAALADQRLDRVVAMATGLSRAQVHDLVAAGAVLVDGRPELRTSRRLDVGQLVEAELPEESGEDQPGPDPSVRLVVVHEDAWLLAVDKPAGLVVHPGAGNRGGTLVNGLLARYPEVATVGEPDRPGIVHRLDKGTSGLLLVARTTPAHAALTGMMMRHEVSRRYLALVEGVVPSDQGVVDAPIGRSARQPTRMAVSAAGRQARTGYVVRHRFPEVGLTLLECTLESGRTHQIRVHLSAIGHPVAGDDQYRGPRRAGVTPPPGLDRPFLHAFQLSFDHPAGTGPLTLTSALPGELAAVLGGLAR